MIPLQILGVFALKSCAYYKRIAGGTAEGMPFVPIVGWEVYFLYNPSGGKNMKQQLENIRVQALAALDAAETPAALEELRVSLLGKKGELTAVLKQMGKLSPEERPVMGQMANEVRAAVEQAELVLVVLDGSHPFTAEDEDGLALGLSAPHCIVIENKSDLPGASPIPPLPEQVPLVRLSALTGDGLDVLERAIEGLFPEDTGLRPGSLLTNARQAEAAGRARQAVSRAADALSMGLSPDAVLSDVEEALTALGELTGRLVREDVTARIFERFCVGK